MRFTKALCIVLLQSAFLSSILASPTDDRTKTAQDTSSMSLQLISEAADSANSAPIVIAPTLLVNALTGANCCPTESFLINLAQRAFDTAQQLPLNRSSVSSSRTGPSDAIRQSDKNDEIADQTKATKRMVFLGLLNWICTRRKVPNIDDLSMARSWAGQVDYTQGVILREEAYGPILKAYIARREFEGVRDVIASAETPSRFPYALAREVVFSPAPATLKTELLERAYAAIRSGLVYSMNDIDFAENTYTLLPTNVVMESLNKCFDAHKPTAQSQKKEEATLVSRLATLLVKIDPTLTRKYSAYIEPPSSVIAGEKAADDPLPRMFEEVQLAAKEGAQALEQRVRAIPDPMTRSQMLLSTAFSLKSSEDLEASNRASQLLSTESTPGTFEGRPVEALLRDTLTDASDGKYSTVQQSLGLADAQIGKDNDNYKKAATALERLRAYQHFSPEPEAIYSFAAGIAPDLAIKSALLVSGPQRSSILTVVMAQICERRTVQQPASPSSKQQLSEEQPASEAH